MGGCASVEGGGDSDSDSDSPRILGKKQVVAGDVRASTEHHGGHLGPHHCCQQHNHRHHVHHHADNDHIPLTCPHHSHLPGQNALQANEQSHVRHRSSSSTSSSSGLSLVRAQSLPPPNATPQLGHTLSPSLRSLSTASASPFQRPPPIPSPRKLPRPPDSPSSDTSFHAPPDFEPLSRVSVTSAAAPSRSTPASANKTPLLLAADTGGLRSFRYSELEAATNKFSRDALLGEGGFGRVFKGELLLDDEKGPVATVVAVKKLNTEGLQGHKEWTAEVNFLGQLRHRNLVRLLGYCAEEKQRLLVYEFMPGGSLESHLYEDTSSKVMSWSMRMRVALDSATGLRYLHEEGEKGVIYRDLKAANILLDSEFNAKLSDFGLAKDGPEGDKSHVSTRVMGTFGYAAPEYIMTGHLSVRSDVYSFGVVMLEIITGRRAVDSCRKPEEQYLVDWSRRFLSDRRLLLSLVDKRLNGKFPKKSVQKALLIAGACVNRDPAKRPTMAWVVESMHGIVEEVKAAAA
eukprot:TRINITY_DN2969_c0_g1_i2.p1 TRINITY_DN2969_c0_g1~~TRINITY_DN2969_c0_g1_i2.p1  ORF type:complete len:516 (-),score=90.42 TRINITY_DN2969_c0_g1_i2:478-2025(-)